MGRLKNGLVCRVTEQPGSRGSSPGTESRPHFSWCWGGRESRAACWQCAGVPLGPGIAARLPVSVKAELASNELCTWHRARKERAPASQTFLKRGHHKHFHPSLMHKPSAGPCAVSVVLTCFPNLYGVGLHNLELKKCWEQKWSEELSPKYFFKNAIGL